MVVLICYSHVFLVWLDIFGWMSNECIFCLQAAPAAEEAKAAEAAITNPETFVPCQRYPEIKDGLR